MPKMKSYASFSEWKADQSAKNKVLIGALQRILTTIAPDLEKIVKWGQGCFTSDGTPVAYIHSAVDHVQLGFYRGAFLHDPQGVLSGKGSQVRFIRIFTKKDINEAAIRNLLLQVV